MRFHSFVAICFTGFVAVGMFGCDVDVEDSGKLPDVDVDVEPGRAPDVEVTGPDVNVGTETKTVEVPDVDVDVDTEKTEVTLPDVDIDVPEENEN